MLIRRPSDILPSEITAQAIYQRRRDFLRHSGLLAMAGAGALWPTLSSAAKLSGVQQNPAYKLGEELTPLTSITTYNNFYEFGLNKEDPAKNAGKLKTRPWTIQISGLCAKPRTFGIEELLKLAPLEERIYRMRCVEGWSMVIPWVGFPLAALLKQVDPLGSAKYVEFATAADKATTPGISRPVLDWPYREALRLDEAMHPLTLMAVGLYGEDLLAQNGAPIRLVVPWKYGFKSAKSIVSIRLTDTMPKTAWSSANPSEYGFYSNVNPHVAHPRWSQATERRIGEFRKRPTLMFNGYADQVAKLYAGMDLKVFF